ncbi:MAG: helix-turn-helix domain-containing protein, partial [bacterium]|nr:helix-turn-helix domain-containing protein [bacterium]
ASIGEGKEGELWLGTIGKGVFRKKEDRFDPFTTEDGLAHNTVTSITKDIRGNVWFSTFEGVSVLDSSQGVIKSLHPGNGLSGKKVRNVYEDDAQNIWLATDNGITVLKEGKLSNQNITRYLEGVDVSCIYQAPSLPGSEGKVFWVTTNGDGLKRLHLKEGDILSINSYTTQNGMTANSLYRLLEDPRGYFWITSKDGILRVSKSQLNDMANGITDRVNCISFGTSDGMQSQEFDNYYSSNSAIETRSGEFIFVTKKGIDAVHPERIRLSQTPPSVLIEGVLFNGRPVSLDPAKVQDPFQGITNLEFHFSALTFLSPGKIIFRYRLEGKEDEWVYLSPGAEPSAPYKDLAPGKYTFHVTARSAEGVWNPTWKSASFYLKPFFYQTFLFKLAVLLLLIALAGLFYLYIKKRRPSDKKAKSKSSPLNPTFAEACITKLKYLMEAEKVYCDADITLQSLAEKISIAPYQLSQLLNEELNRSFTDYINWHRIEEAKRVLQSPKGSKRKISSIAIDVGFNTMAAFYKVFKKYTGTTPTEYKKNGNQT